MAASVPSMAGGGEKTLVASEPRSKDKITDDLKLVTDRLRERRKQLQNEQGRFSPVEFNLLVRNIESDVLTQDALLAELWDACCWLDPSLLGGEKENGSGR